MGILKQTYTYSDSGGNVNNPLMVILFPLAILAIIFRRRSLPEGWLPVIAGAVIYLAVSSLTDAGGYRTVFYYIHAPLLLLFILLINTLSYRERTALIILGLSLLCLWPQRKRLIDNMRLSMPYFIGIQSWEDCTINRDSHDPDIRIPAAERRTAEKK